MRQYFEKKEKKIKNNQFFKNLLKSKAYYGLSIKKSHQKSFPFAYGIRSNQLIIDLGYTIQSIKRSFALIHKILTTKKSKILIVANDIKTQTLITNSFSLNQNKKNRIIITNKKRLSDSITNLDIRKDIGVILSFSDTYVYSLIKESKSLKIPLICPINTKVNPELIEYPIVINTNNIKSTFFLIFLFSKFLNEIQI